MQSGTIASGVIALLVVCLVLVGVRWHNQRKAAREKLLKQQDKEERRARRRQRREARIQETWASIKAPAPGLERRPVILVVDDSDTVRQSLKKLMEDNRYRVLLAENGRRAWAILQDQRPDLVISDIDMPHLNGFQLVSLIRKDLSLADVPIILMTSHLAYDVPSGPESGINGFLTKPYQPNDVLEQIRFILAE